MYLFVSFRFKRKTGKNRIMLQMTFLKRYFSKVIINNNNSGAHRWIMTKMIIGFELIVLIGE